MILNSRSDPGWLQPAVGRGAVFAIAWEKHAVTSHNESIDCLKKITCFVVPLSYCRTLCAVSFSEGSLLHLLQVFIINLLRDSKYFHFRPVMDTYIQKHFAGALAYK